jgi:hypothetical protein
MRDGSAARSPRPACSRSVREITGNLGSVGEALERFDVVELGGGIVVWQISRAEQRVAAHDGGNASNIGSLRLSLRPAHGQLDCKAGQ